MRSAIYTNKYLSNTVYYYTMFLGLNVEYQHQEYHRRHFHCQYLIRSFHFHLGPSCRDIYMFPTLIGCRIQLNRYYDTQLCQIKRTEKIFFIRKGRVFLDKINFSVVSCVCVIVFVSRKRWFVNSVGCSFGSFAGFRINCYFP